MTAPERTITYPSVRGQLHILWPPDARCGRFRCQHLSRPRPRNLRDALHATPLGGYQEQCPIAHTSEHASEATAVKIDRLQHRTAFADAHAALVGDVSVPDGFVGVDADAVGNAAAEGGPHPPVRQAPVRRDVERGEPPAG